MSAPSESRAWPIYGCAGVLLFSYGTVFALLAELQATYGLPTWGVGLVAGASFLAGLAVQPVFGSYADRGHVGRLVRGGVLVGGIGMVWFGLSSSLWSFVAARALLGVGNGAFMPAARRAVTDIDPQTGRALGRLMAVEAGGFVVGPSIAALLSEGFGLRVAFIAPGVLLLVASAAVRVPPRTAPTAGRGTPLWELLRDPRTQGALLLAVSYSWAIGTFDAMWAKFLSDRGASTTFIGVSLLVFALPLVLLPSRTGGFAERLGPQRVAIAAQLVTGLVLCGYVIARGALVACAVALVQSLFDATAGPAGQLHMANVVGGARFAEGQGLYGAVGLGAAGVAAVVSAALYAQWGSTVMWLVAAVVVAGTAELSWRRGGVHDRV